MTPPVSEMWSDSIFTFDEKAGECCSSTSTVFCVAPSLPRQSF